MEELLRLSKSFSIKMKRDRRENRNHSIQDRSKAQYADPAGRLHQKLQDESQNLAYVLSGRDHISAE